MATSVQTGKAKQLTLFGFLAIMALMVVAVYEYPTFATLSFSLISFLLLGGVLQFILMGLCATGMATVGGWEEGGAFTWVSDTPGPRWGFAAISSGYLQVAIGFIPMLYSVLGVFSHTLKWLALDEGPTIKTIAALTVLWVLALTQFGGMKYTAWTAKVGFFADILLPAFILIVLAAIYLHFGASVVIEMDSKTFFPDFSKAGTLVVFVAFILSYMGVEVFVAHTNGMDNPGRDYPLAMLLLMAATICLSSTGGLFIAAVVPGNEINPSAEVMQTSTVLVSHMAPGIEWTARVTSALLLLGIPAEIVSWVVSPSRGIYVIAQKNLSPAVFAKVNKNGVPITLTISQLVITSIALIILTNAGGGNNMFFLIALTLTVVIYLCTYFMLSINYIVLVLKCPDLERTLNIPGSKGMRLVMAIVSLPTSVMAFTVSFLPPGNIQGDSIDMYIELLVVSFLVVLVLPFILYAVRDREGKTNTGVALGPINSQNAPEGHFFLHPRIRSPHRIVMNDKERQPCLNGYKTRER